MSLPDKFQFRTKTNLGFTHTAKKNANGDYEVEWAKGWLKLNNNTDPWIVAPDCDIKHFVESGGWLIVDDAPREAVKEDLPVIFYIVSSETTYEMVKTGSVWRCWHPGKVGELGHGAAYDERRIRQIVASGVWKILDKKPLTAEQKRANKEFQEQINALNASIKISEQAVDHQQRMQANYNERIAALKAKIVEGV